MTNVLHLSAEKRRREENERVLNRMKDKNDNLCHTGLNAFRWSPRPVIKKDQDAINKLYGKKD